MGMMKGTAFARILLFLSLSPYLTWRMR